MIKFSAIIIAKNSEDIIADCLKSVSFCDEIIIVDGGSTDQTIAIAKKAGGIIISGADSDFAEQRNIGLKKAKGEWILYIDTDERVSPSLREEIIQYTNNPIIKNPVLRLKRKNFYLGKHEWPYIESLERLFKKESLKRWYGELHESPEFQGTVGDLDGFLLHYTHRNLSSMVEKTNQWSNIEAKLRFDTHHPKMIWWRFFRVMWTGFYESYFKQQGWKVGTAGLVESMYQACSMFITYAKLWELQKKS